MMMRLQSRLSKVAGSIVDGVHATQLYDRRQILCDCYESRGKLMTPSFIKPEKFRTLSEITA
jgi:hypothetical protein